MKYEFTPRGVCSQKIDLDVENGSVNDVMFVGGCNGNLRGISSLVKGMTVEAVIEKLSGIRCGMKPTSCPDQLAAALKNLV